MAATRCNLLVKIDAAMEISERFRDAGIFPREERKAAISRWHLCIRSELIADDNPQRPHGASAL